MCYSFHFYRAAKLGEIGPILEQEQRFAKNKTDAIKTGKLMAKSYEWRLICIRDENDNTIYE